MKLSRTINKRITDKRIFTAAIVTLASFLSFEAVSAESSYEFMCKSKAKEIAAETYKNCIVENKQAQVDKIKKEYQDRLAELKAQYNKELKALKSGQISKKTKVEPETKVSTIDNAQEEDVKKIKKNPKVRIEKIEFTEGAQPKATAQVINQIVEENPADQENASALQSEVIELPVQQE